MIRLWLISIDIEHCSLSSTSYTLSKLINVEDIAPISLCLLHTSLCDGG